jgi:small basic protein
MYHEYYLISFAAFCLIMGYITLFLKETRDGWNISSKYVLYIATAATFVFSGLMIGFAVTLAYIVSAVIIVVVSLPLIRLLLEKLRNR